MLLYIIMLLYPAPHALGIRAGILYNIIYLLYFILLYLHIILYFSRARPHVTLSSYYQSREAPLRDGGAVPYYNII
jgi:hypothetical protein